MTTEPQPPRVSDEDRESAALLISPDVQGAGYEYPTIDGARGAIDHLVDGLGWGPKPAVSAAKLDQYLALATMGRAASASSAMRGFLRECGIEVTDD